MENKISEFISNLDPIQEIKLFNILFPDSESHAYSKEELDEMIAIRMSFCIRKANS